MQKITLLLVGRPKTPWIVEGVEQFSKRLRFSYDLRIVEVAPSKSPDAAKQREEESKKILEHIEKLPGEKILLDEQGDAMTSVEFSTMLTKAMDHGVHVTFILGGSFGVLDSVRSAVQKSLKLSDMTFPHELCALVFLEQLYRAAEIAKGSGYQH
jgi:23S rRNA (pseudouridine1915-N3)-methyltransferase